MARISDREKKGLSFWLDENGSVKHNKICERCSKSCKQSHRAAVISCNNYKRR